MRQAITNLGKEQNLQLQHLLQHYNLDNKTSAKTQKYYRELRKIYIHFDPSHYKTEDLMRAAIVVAEKSQTVYTLTGQRAKGLGISLNEMIRENAALKQLINVIRIFMTHSKIIEEDLREDLVQIVAEATFGMAFLEKFQRALSYFDFEELVEAGYEYSKVFRSFTWLFFLQVHFKLNIKSEFEADYLLISVLYLMVRYSFDYLRPRNIPKITNKSQKYLITSILQKLFQIFLIDDAASFKKITARVDDYFESLIGSETIKCHDFENYDFLSPSLISLNYKKIDMQYQRETMGISTGIDYRLFLNNRHTTFTPRKYSHVSNKEKHDKRKEKDYNIRKSFASHKILTFELEEGPKENQQPCKFKQVTLPANIKISPSFVKAPLICAYQQSPHSSIESYMRRSIRQSQLSIETMENQQEIFGFIKQSLQYYALDNAKEKAHIIYNFYLVSVSEYLKKEYVSWQNLSNLHSSFLIYALQFMVYSSLPYSPEIYESVRQILEYIRGFIVTDGYYLALVNRYFMDRRDRMPSALKSVISGLQEYICHEVLWQDDSTACQVRKIIAGENREEDPFIYLVQKLIEDSQDNISKIVKSFSIEDSFQVEAQIFSTIKYVILFAPHLLQGRSLVQILLCSTYLILRARGISIKFNEIVLTYQRVNHLKPLEFKRLINQIRCSDDEDANIIQLYNELFLPELKEHIGEIKGMCHSHSKPSGTKRQEAHLERFSSNKALFKKIKDKPRKSATENSPKEIHVYENRLETQMQLLDAKKVRQTQKQQYRNETTIRIRPLTSFQSCIGTQKIKSPTCLR